MIESIFVRLILLVPLFAIMAVLGKQLYLIVTCQIGEETE